MKMNRQNRIFRRLYCPIYLYHVFVEITCIGSGCRYWTGIRCSHRRKRKTGLLKRFHRTKRLKLGRRDRGRKDRRFEEISPEMENETDNVHLDFIEIDTLDYGFSGLPK